MIRPGKDPLPKERYTIAPDPPRLPPVTDLTIPSATPRFPVEEADRCVLCGLCLPHCPTYRATGDENESPRGRVSLMRALANGALPASERLAGHLSLCLGCRACERVCPSGVQYGRLIEAGRALVASTHRPKLAARLGLRLVARPRWVRVVAALLRLYQRSGLQRLVRVSGLLRILRLQRLEALLPKLPAAQTWSPHYPAEGAPRGRVALFLGCVARELDADTLGAAIRVLTRLGFEVQVPADQACCGALHREAGDGASAQRLRARNAAAFRTTGAEAIVTLASGCGATLAEYEREGAAPGAPVRDIHAFLADVPLPAGVTLAPLPQTIAVHDACSLRNALRAEQSVYRLLARIPGLRLAPLPDNHLCCGGAGAYALREPVMAGRLRDAKIAHLERLRPDALVSANIGCMLHLGAGLRARGLDIPVMHPVTLFERQLKGETAGGRSVDSKPVAAA